MLASPPLKKLSIGCRRGGRTCDIWQRWHGMLPGWSKPCWHIGQQPSHATRGGSGKPCMGMQRRCTQPVCVPRLRSCDSPCRPGTKQPWKHPPGNSSENNTDVLSTKVLTEAFTEAVRTCVQARSWVTSKLLETREGRGRMGLVQDPFGACKGSCIITGGTPSRASHTHFDK